MVTSAAAPQQHAEGAPRRRCVLIVHGVGEQRKSDTLLYIGSPLVSWVQRWARLFYGRDAAEVRRVELSFVPYDVGGDDRPAYAVVELPGEQWFFAEAWWAGSDFHPDLATMLGWSFVHLFDILAQMLRSTVERGRYLFKPKDSATSSQPSPLWQAVDLFNCVVLGLTYAVACVVGYVLLVPLMLLAQIPIDAVQNFVLLKMLQPVLTVGAGEFRVYMDDELQAANIRRRVGDAARGLLRLADSDELMIVAHSEGCVVSFGMLTDPVYTDVASRTRKLLTFGAGLNKTWLLRPDLDRLFGPLRGDILWTDFWASYDPVPAGALDPSRRRLAPDRKCGMVDIYKPEGDALAQVGADKPPINEQVTNGMNVLTDHGGYFSNDEQVLVRLAAEISGPWHTRSAFWPANDVLLDGVRERRKRVSALALWRDIAVGLWLASAFAPWLLGWIQGVSPWAPISSLSAVTSLLSAPARWLVDALLFLRDSLPTALAPISGMAATLLQLPAFAGLALLLGVIAWAVYALVVAVWWQRWDTRARTAFLERCVTSSQARLRESTPESSAIV